MKFIIAFVFIVGLMTGLFFVALRYGLVKIKPITSSPVTTSSTTKVDAEVATKQDLDGSIVFGGDVMLARWVEQKAVKNGWENMFSDVKDAFSGDCKIVNLESPFKSNKPQTKIGSLVFAAKPESLQALESIAVTAVSLANNHITDQGLGGFEETTKLLQEKKILYGGAGTSAELAQKPVALTCGKIKVGIIFATYGTNLPADGLGYANVDDVPAVVKKIDKDFDIVIVYPHWGTEYNPAQSPYQTEMAHKFVDAGADLVVGSHPHVLQPVEIYKNKVIAYSLGNMVFDQAPSGTKTEGALLKVAYKDGKSSFEIVPIAIKDYYKPTVALEKENDFKERLNLNSLKWGLSESQDS